MILVVIIQLLISYYFIQFFNKYAYDTWSPYDKVYICRFLQIILYLLSLIPSFLIMHIVIFIYCFSVYDYPYFKSSVRYKKWYKYLFENPNE